MGRLAPNTCMPGHLTSLQIVHLQRGTSLDNLKPSQLMHSITLFLPLPSLTEIGFLHKGLVSAIMMSMNVRGEQIDVAIQRAALHRLATQLSLAPMLHLTHLNLICNNWREPVLSLTHISEGLRPLRGQLRHLSFVNFIIPDLGWIMLSSSLPKVNRLSFLQGRMSAGGLAAIGRSMQYVRRLDIDSVHMLPMEDSWLDLAHVRCHPLRVVCAPQRPDESMVAKCRDVQDQMYNCQYIDWWGASRAHML